MTEAMQVWRRSARWNRQLKAGQQFVECPSNSVRANRRPFRLVKCKHRAVGRNRPKAPPSTIQKFCNREAHPWPEWDQSILSKFRLTNHQKLVLEIDVLAAQPRHFADAKPQTIQQHEDHPIDSSAVLRS